MPNPHLFCTAPMMDMTDRHARFLFRLFTKRALLYTEMVYTQAILRGDQKRFLRFHNVEHPIALQLGGDDPQALAEAAKIGQDWGYDEINLNLGCPSEKVKAGHFGACLMKEPQLVTQMLIRAQAAVTIPVTIKIRIGVDDLDSYEHLTQFVNMLSSESSCRTFIVHARKAWLKGLSPKQNRTVPPLKYETVYKLKKDFPHLNIIINGGIKTSAEINDHLRFVDGVMIGRQAYEEPVMLANVDHEFFGEPVQVVILGDIIAQLLEYARKEHQDHGTRILEVTQHWDGLFHGIPNGKIFRKLLHGAKSLAELERAVAEIGSRL